MLAHKPSACWTLVALWIPPTLEPLFCSETCARILDVDPVINFALPSSSVSIVTTECLLESVCCLSCLWILMPLKSFGSLAYPLLQAAPNDFGGPARSGWDSLWKASLTFLSKLLSQCSWSPHSPCSVTLFYLLALIFWLFIPPRSPLHTSLLINEYFIVWADSF